MPPSPPLIHIHSDTLSNVCTCRGTRVHLQTSASAPGSFLLLWQGEGCGNMLPFVRSRSALKTIMEVYWTNFRNELGKPSAEASSLNHQSHTYLAGEIPCSRRWFSKGEAYPLHSMKLEPIIQSEVSQKDKDHYNILTHIYGI